MCDIYAFLANPDGAECYGLSTTEMSDWLADFSNTYYDGTGRCVASTPPSLSAHF
jgi:hypothetical protein